MLNGVEVGRIGWQKQQSAPRRLHKLAQTGGAVKARVVQNDHTAPGQRRQKHLGEVSLHHGAVAMPLEDHRRDEPVALARGDDARAPAPRARHLRDDLLAARGPCVRRVQAVVDTAFIKETHRPAAGLQRGQILPEAFPPRLVPLGV